MKRESNPVLDRLYRNRDKVVLLFIIALSCCRLHAQTTLTGKVFDKDTKQPIRPYYLSAKKDLKELLKQTSGSV